MAASLDTQPQSTVRFELPGRDDRHPDLLNRELSWLAFNDRVLALAGDSRVPLLERVKFLAIFSGNLDEYFQVRVAGLKDQVAAGVTATTADGRTPREQLDEIRAWVLDSTKRQQELWLGEVRPALHGAGVRLCSWDDLSDDDRAALSDEFDRRIFPVLTPLAVDPGHPFPYISNLSLSLAVRLLDGEDEYFARVKVPDILPRFLPLDDDRFIRLEIVIAAHLDRLFPGMAVLEQYRFRVTRNADLTYEEETADDLLELVEIELRRRRFARAVRLEVDSSMSDEIRNLLCEELEVDPDDLYEIDGPVDLSGLWGLTAVDRPDLRYPVWSSITDPRLEPGDDGRIDIFAELQRGDLLVHHPYTSFTTSVVELIRQAAIDPKVLAIKLTLYRTSGDSPIIEALIRAAESGKQVAVLVELKARFDERNNIEWARQLEQSGVHVAYGIAGLKIHTKTCLVVRDEPGGIRRYSHIGTGNYNTKTARLYEDIGLLSADPATGNDLSLLFNHLTGYGRETRYERVVVAPEQMRPEFERLITNEMAADEPHIIIKSNSLVDEAMIRRLYDASRAGVEIDLVIRGICCLRPGVPGVSDNIRVRSIVGRYLEHSRIYYFANGDGPGRQVMLIGSADLMPRNLDRRIEALVRVTDAECRRRLTEIIEIALADDQLAWELQHDGGWVRETGPAAVESHVTNRQRVLQRASGEG